MCQADRLHTPQRVQQPHPAQGSAAGECLCLALLHCLLCFLHAQPHAVQMANKLSGPIPPLGALSQLKVLHLGANELSGTLPPDWLSSSALRYYDVSYNKLRQGCRPCTASISRAACQSMTLTCVQRHCATSTGHD